MADEETKKPAKKKAKPKPKPPSEGYVGGSPYCSNLLGFCAAVDAKAPWTELRGRASVCRNLSRPGVEAESLSEMLDILDEEETATKRNKIVRLMTDLRKLSVCWI